MDHRVNIRYSIEIADLPQEVERLLGNAQAEVKAFKKLTGAWNKDLLTLSMERIDHIRQRLADIDYMLNDVSTIVNGYIAYKAQAALQPPAGSQMSTGEAQDTVLEEHLQNFKTQLGRLGEDNEVAP
jgi:hypothetical protein